MLNKLFADPKTTLTALVGAIAQIVAIFGFDVSFEVQIAIVTITVFILGLLSRDTIKEIPPQRDES